MYSYYLKEPKKQSAEGQQLAVPKPKPEKQKLPVKTSLSDLSVGEWHILASPMRRSGFLAHNKITASNGI